LLTFEFSPALLKPAAGRIMITFSTHLLPALLSGSPQLIFGTIAIRSSNYSFFPFFELTHFPVYPLLERLFLPFLPRRLVAPRGSFRLDCVKINFIATIDAWARPHLTTHHRQRHFMELLLLHSFVIRSFPSLISERPFRTGSARGPFKVVTPPPVNHRLRVGLMLETPSDFPFFTPSFASCSPTPPDSHDALARVVCHSPFPGRMGKRFF